jgi:thiol:disulfide interchange protein
MSSLRWWPAEVGVLVGSLAVLAYALGPQLQHGWIVVRVWLVFVLFAIGAADVIVFQLQAARIGRLERQLALRIEPGIRPQGADGGAK